MKLATFLAMFAMLGIGVALQMLVLINGWGMEPRSWWWIIGVGLFGQLLAQTLSAKVLNAFQEAWK